MRSRKGRDHDPRRGVTGAITGIRDELWISGKAAWKRQHTGKTQDRHARVWKQSGELRSCGVCCDPGWLRPPLPSFQGATKSCLSSILGCLGPPLTIRFTMIILGPSVLLMVKMCMSRRQNMVKSRERMMRPVYSSEGMSLQRSRASVGRPGPGPSPLPSCPGPRYNSEGTSLMGSRASADCSRAGSSPSVTPDPKALKLGVSSGAETLGGSGRPTSMQRSWASWASWEAAGWPSPSCS